jgi:hypothetical protein
MNSKNLQVNIEDKTKGTLGCLFIHQKLMPNKTIVFQSPLGHALALVERLTKFQQKN